MTLQSSNHSVGSLCRISTVSLSLTLMMLLLLFSSYCNAFIVHDDMTRTRRTIQQSQPQRLTILTASPHIVIKSHPTDESNVGTTSTYEKTTTTPTTPTTILPRENSDDDSAKLTTTTATKAGGAAAAAAGARLDIPFQVWKTKTPTLIQGGSLRTWTFTTDKIKTVQVHLRTDGRPLNANVELWQGPDNTPEKMAVYVEDGKLRPVVCFMATPYGQNSVSIRNTAQLEYPIQSVLEAGQLYIDDERRGDVSATLQSKMQLLQNAKRQEIQGGAVMTKPFSSTVDSVQILIETNGRPLNCRIELLSGPNNVKQCMEVYTEDGQQRPFYTIMQTPGVGNTVRIVNTATIEFPILARVEPWKEHALEEEEKENYGLVVIGSGMDDTPVLEVGGSKKWDSTFFY